MKKLFVGQQEFSAAQWERWKVTIADWTVCHCTRSSSVSLFVWLRRNWLIIETCSLDSTDFYCLFIHRLRSVGPWFIYKCHHLTNVSCWFHCKLETFHAKQTSSLILLCLTEVSLLVHALIAMIPLVRIARPSICALTAAHPSIWALMAAHLHCSHPFKMVCSEISHQFVFHLCTWIHGNLGLLYFNASPHST